MIKLNNKNITYVALADSNNSIKAPKEIWYANSNNSVKLVYRRKDALIEGEDYEKYHWLTGDRRAYIDTKVLLKNISNYKIKIQITNLNYTGGIFGARISAKDDVNLEVFTYSSGTILLGMDFGDYEQNRKSYAVQSGNQYRIEWSNGELSVNGENIATIQYTTSSEMTAKLFASQNFVSTDDQRIFRDKIASLVISDVIDLVPVKLLKPVPKWLDANGIRRQVGECGMIDLVSGKFYGNVNSVGTFTVENYYERKEWLVADIPDNKRCIDLPINSNEMSYSMLIQKAGNNTFFETISNYRYYTTYGTIPSIKVWNIATSSDVGTFNVGLQTNKLFNITSNESSLTINGIGVQKFGFPISAVVLRSGATLGNAITETSSIFVNGVERYIPCTLTMDLPASMDANNIARTKGTSGMWDLVSDRFYGNVASSGTFKAVNLAEGVDYEVHDWLVGDGTAHIVKNFNFWQNKLEVEVGDEQGNQFSTNYNETGVYVAAVYNRGGGNPYMLVAFRETTIGHIGDVLYSQFPERLSMVFYIEDGIAYCNQNGTLNTGQQLTESVWNKDIPLRIYAKEMSYIREVLPNDTYHSNLVPVKLLRSIPAKYDANGIARQVGECGMYDTLNDVFYGNVASSGTFSVSDDN